MPPHDVSPPADPSSDPAASTAESRPATPIYVISLPGASGRRSAFERRAADSTVPWSYVDACTGMVPGLSYRESDAVVAKGRPLKPGELGCYASHFSIWTEMVASRTAQAIVLEDDVIADWTMIARIAATDFSSLGIEYLRLYGKVPCVMKPIRRNFLDQAHTLVEMRGLVYGTQGYLVTREGARRLAEICRTVRRPIDDEMDRSWGHGLPNLGIFPFPIVEEAAASSIGSTRFAPFPIPEALRRRRYLARIREKLLKVVQPLTRYGFSRLGPEPPTRL